MTVLSNVGWKNGLKLFYSALLHFDRLHGKNGQFVTQYMKNSALAETRKMLKL